MRPGKYIRSFGSKMFGTFVLYIPQVNALDKLLYSLDDLFKHIIDVGSGVVYSFTYNRSFVFSSIDPPTVTTTLPENTSTEVSSSLLNDLFDKIIGVGSGAVYSFAYNFVNITSNLVFTNVSDAVLSNTTVNALSSSATSASSSKTEFNNCPVDVKTIKKKCILDGIITFLPFNTFIPDRIINFASDVNFTISGIFCNVYDSHGDLIGFYCATFKDLLGGYAYVSFPGFIRKGIESISGSSAVCNLFSFPDVFQVSTDTYNRTLSNLTYSQSGSQDLTNVDKIERGDIESICWDLAPLLIPIATCVCLCLYKNISYCSSAISSRIRNTFLEAVDMGIFSLPSQNTHRPLDENNISSASSASHNSVIDIPSTSSANQNTINDIPLTTLSSVSNADVNIVNIPSTSSASHSTVIDISSTPSSASQLHCPHMESNL